MTSRLPLLGALLVLPLIGACTSPAHLQYDFGRSYTESLSLQTDLTRPSVDHATYPLYGVEAVEIRLRVREAMVEQKAADVSLDF